MSHNRRIAGRSHAGGGAAAARAGRRPAPDTPPDGIFSELIYMAFSGRGAYPSVPPPLPTRSPYGF